MGINNTESFIRFLQFHFEMGPNGKIVGRIFLFFFFYVQLVKGFFFEPKFEKVDDFAKVGVSSKICCSFEDLSAE